VAECQCGKEYHRESPTDGRARLDPLDPSTFRHVPACDQRDITDPAIIRATLRVQDSEGYWWVESGMCACCWQTPFSLRRMWGDVRYEAELRQRERHAELRRSTSVRAHGPLAIKEGFDPTLFQRERDG
jgi:hypothetical protein